ncbi:ABC transporter, permease protein [Croceitalea dokdonensis DOKDO 023]|uniref:ABC transporter, permease protein n=1 Tax=Croceitalea dokdonensis DOKDO 023 TaxID=1300341 RepID=A0A0P7AYC4_9FLAO|nr:ABC transporter permease [Croceitalea dokdonensis]KPM31371.1 ABC transporter, permease protein [Croceitalea dokdonensis DOKDO 023]
MFSRDTWKEIFETIQKNKLRTFLTGFTVAVGIFIFVTLFGMGNGLNNTFMEFFGNDATNIFRIYPSQTTIPYGGFKAKRQIEFKNEDIDEIVKEFAPLIDYTTPQIQRNATVTYGEESDNYNTRGVAPGMQFAEKNILMRGRFINTNDLKERAKFAVIGRMVQRDLFKGENPIGEYIDIGGSAFKVIGVFQDDGGDNEERYIYIPYTTRQLIEGNNDKIDQITLAFKESIGYSGAMRFQGKLDAFIRQQKIISPKDPRGIFIENVADNLKRNQQFANVLKIIISGIAFAVIISGIIGISNIMVFVVKERTKEIGIRKAMGATPGIITRTILLESVFITTLFGFVGMIAGIIVLNFIRGDELKDNYFITDPAINSGTAIFVTILLIICGTIAAYIPARRAARIKPIVALRDE